MTWWQAVHAAKDAWWLLSRRGITPRGLHLVEPQEGDAFYVWCQDYAPYWTVELKLNGAYRAAFTRQD